MPLPRNGRRPGAVPEPPRWSTAPQPRAGPNRPRSLPVDWRRFLREALGPRPKAGLWPLRKQKEPEKGPPARGLQQVEGRKLPNNLRPRRGPCPACHVRKRKTTLTHRRKEGPLPSERKEAGDNQHQLRVRKNREQGFVVTGTL